MSATDYTFTFYGFWRSAPSWRVRIVLNLYNIPYEYKPVNLLAGEQRSPEYIEGISAHGLVPALKVFQQSSSSEPTTTIITQSLAIIEFLDSYHNNGIPRLLPTDPFKRARVQEIVYSIACDIHPVQNLRVLQTYPEEARHARGKEVVETGLRAIERLVGREGRCCVGEEVTLADVLLAPQVHVALRFAVDVSQFPRILAIYEYLMTLPAFENTRPEIQPDAPQETQRNCQ